MKSLLFSLLASLFIQFTLSADERIGGTLENVDLFQADLYNDDGHNFGEKYSVINRNDHPMRVSIKLTSSQNIDNHLVPYSIVLPPHKKGDLGYITQQDPKKGSDWKYEWQVKKDIN